MSNAIEVSGAGKRYTKYEDTPMLISSLRVRARTRRNKLWAVRGIDLEVPKGSTVGLIGRNGSGKTTLMSMMAGVTAPTEGSIRVWGRVAPLIAVGVGFHQELTGRENVYLNGSVLGLTRRQIDDRMDAIVAFAEVDEFLDTPVKFYSSGMYVRLGFAVAVHSDPEVLLVDEVLAVGDLAFQMKCFERMEQIREAGTTIVVISHNLTAVLRVSHQVLVLQNGRPDFLGAPADAVARFHEIMSEESENVDIDSGMRLIPGIVEILSLELLDEEGRPTTHVVNGAPLTARLHTRALADVDSVSVTFAVLGADGTAVYTDSSLDGRLGSLSAGEETVFTMPFRAHVATGSYSIAGYVKSGDLRSLFANSRAVSFFVSGRISVGGVADLQGEIARLPTEDSLLGSVASAHEEMSSQPSVAHGGAQR
jgi:ABC-type polysaccharide/polyol phosphate transport system ATPase subunit